MLVKDVVCTCDACPSQWTARTVDDKPVYIRYRWGNLSVSVDRQEIFSETIGGKFDGVLSWSKALEYINTIPYPINRNAFIEPPYTQERYDREKETGRCSYCNQPVLECQCDDLSFGFLP